MLPVSLAVPSEPPESLCDHLGPSCCKPGAGVGGQECVAFSPDLPIT